MLLKCNETVDGLVQGNEYVAMAVRVTGTQKEVLVYNDPWNSFVDINLFDAVEDQYYPSDWVKSPTDSSGCFYLGYKELIDNPKRHYMGLIERKPEDLRAYHLEYTRQVLNDPEARTKIARYDTIHKLDLFPDFAEVANQEASALFKKIDEADASLVVYMTAQAPWSLRTESYLKEHGIDYLPVDITDNPQLLDYVIDVLGQHVTPVCISDNEVVAVGYEPEAMSRFKNRKSH